MDKIFRNQLPISNKCYFLILFGLSLLAGSCSNDDDIAVLDARLSSDSEEMVAIEGSPFFYNYSLSKALTEDLPLEILISTTNTVAAINPNDYSKEFIYKGNLDTEWKTANGNKIVFPKGSTNLKIRLNTIDDNRIETHEQFYFTLLPDQDNFTKNDFEISNLTNLDPVASEVTDDDESPEASGLDYIPFEYKVEKVGDEYSFTLLAGNKTVPTPFLKQFFDKSVEDGLPSPIRDAVSTVLKAGDQTITVNRLNLINTPGIGGSVSPSTSGDGSWDLSLNLVVAYPTAPLIAEGSSEFNPIGIPIQFTEAQFDKFLEEEYNPGGDFAYVLIHEYGHLMTLAAASQYDDTPRQNCTTYYSDQCTTEDSFLNLFYNEFYAPFSNVAVAPEHVTAYAASLLEEDVAETFAFHIGQKDIPPLEADGSSSTALKKVNFMKNYMKFHEYNFRELRSLATEVDANGDFIAGAFGNLAIRAFRTQKHSCIMTREELVKRINENKTNSETIKK